MIIFYLGEWRSQNRRIHEGVHRPPSKHIAATLAQVQLGTSHQPVQKMLCSLQCPKHFIKVSIYLIFFSERRLWAWLNLGLRSHTAVLVFSDNKFKLKNTFRINPTPLWGNCCSTRGKDSNFQWTEHVCTNQKNLSRKSVIILSMSQSVTFRNVTH